MAGLNFCAEKNVDAATSAISIALIDLNCIPHCSILSQTEALIKPSPMVLTVTEETAI